MYRHLRGERDDSTIIRCDATRRHCTGSDCRAQFGRALTRSGMLHLCDSAVAGPAARRDNVLARALVILFLGPLQNPRKTVENIKDFLTARALNFPVTSAEGAEKTQPSLLLEGA